MAAEPIRLLLVEDNPDDQQLIREHISQMQEVDAALECVHDYQRGLQELQHFRHDLYLIDYRLGTNNGLQLLQDAIGSGCTAPIIMLTGLPDRDIDTEAMRLGAIDHLDKNTLDGDGLQRAIRNALARRQAEHALRQSEQRLRAIMENIDEVVYVVTRNEHNQLLTRPQYVTQGAWEMMGYEAREFLRDPTLLLKIIHPDDRQHVNEYLQHQFEHKTHTRLEYRIQHRATGEYRWLENRVGQQIGDTGEVEALVGIAQDITERKASEQQMRRAALHDPLTGLPNRSLLMDHLASAIARGQADSDYAWALMFLDLDKFKPVNDSMGHDAGDELLISVSRRIRSCLRPEDTLARLGGDEFIVLMEVTRQKDTGNVAERIQACLGTPYKIQGRKVSCTASIGVTTSRARYQTPEDALRDADAAMYHVKKAGRAGHAVYESQLMQRPDVAVPIDQIIVHYQPVVAMATGEVLSLEALARWQHPQQGLIEPPGFIPDPHSTGFIVALGHWVLKAACSQMRLWRQPGSGADGLATLGLNLSMQEFRHAELINRLQRELERTGLQATDLRLEFTESALTSNEDTAARILEQLVSLGIEVVIDDFGRGVSALSHLYRLPISALKIDQALIQHIESDQHGADLVRAIIHLGQDLGIEVIAKGVETAVQAEHLTAMGCDYAQGFYYSPAVAAEAIPVLLAPRASRGVRP